MATAPGQKAVSSAGASSDRLDSWKEIAAHLKRNVRTVQRWEHTEGLPIHRHLHTARGSVYASAAELETWWRERAGQLEPHDNDRPAWFDRRILWWAVGTGVAILGVGAAVLGTWTRDSISSVPPRSIAVLPFKPLVATEADERLQLGLTEAVINQLSRIKTLRIEPLARVRRFRSLDQDPLEAGRALRVEAVLEGHFQQTQSGVQVRSRLLRTRDGTALAINQWHEPFRNILDVQGRLAESLAEALGLTLTSAERARIRRQDTNSPEAFRHYLFGRYHLEVRSYERMLEAERELREALRLDPRYARAHAALSLTLTHMAWLGGPRGIDVMGPAKDAALQALAIDDSVALAHTALAYVHDYFEYDSIRAQSEHLRAMELDDQDLWVLRAYGSFLMRRDAFDEALEVIRRALDLDPTSPLSNRHKAMMLYVARRYDECVAESRRTLTLDPDDLSLSYQWLARCLEQQGKQRQAVDAYEKGRAARGNPALAERMKRLYAAHGWEAYWRERLRLDNGVESAAAAHVRLGNIDEAIRSFERAYDARSPWINSSNHPEWDPLRSDPRFQALRQRAGRSDEINAELSAARRAARSRRGVERLNHPG
jgi:TolB-like protein/Tfp pilus assembly protein PilF